MVYFSLVILPLTPKNSINTADKRHILRSTPKIANICLILAFIAKFCFNLPKFSKQDPKNKRFNLTFALFESYFKSYLNLTLVAFFSLHSPKI